MKKLDEGAAVQAGMQIGCAGVTTAKRVSMDGNGVWSTYTGHNIVLGIIVSFCLLFFLVGTQ
jgi:hypothetical protein